MTDKGRIKLAALVVAVFLGGVSAAGLLSHTGTPNVAVTGHIPSAHQAPAAPAPIHSQTFEHDSND